jgi:hypothetical protein
MTGTLTGTPPSSTGTGTFQNAREGRLSSLQAEHENATGTHENASDGNGNHPLFRGGSRPCPSCGAQSSAPRYWGHSMRCPAFWRLDVPDA